jgi:tetratricopeptide (TPR) repeat protein
MLCSKKLTFSWQMSMTSALLYVVIANGCAISLDRLAHETRSFREMCKRYRVDTVLTTLDATMQSMLNFMGCSKDPLTLTGEFLSEDEAMQDAKLNNPVTYGALLVCKHWLVVYFNDMVGSLEVSRKLRQVKLDKVLPFTVIEHKFLIGFAAARLSRSRESKKRQAHHILSQLRKHATVCPQNYQNKVYLMEAELSSSARCHEDAMAKYRLSIEFAREQHFHHEEGLAWEGAGLAMRDCERWEESREYFLQARSCYERWGAKAKVDHIDSFLNPAEN